MPGLSSLITMAGTSVVVVNNMTGVLGVYGPEGNTVAVVSLPTKLLGQVFEYRRRVDQSFGVAAVSAVYKDVVGLPDGRVLVLLGIPGADAVLIDVESRSAVLLNAPEGPRGSAVRRASSVAMRGDRLVFVTIDGLAFFRLIDA